MYDQDDDLVGQKTPNNSTRCCCVIIVKYSRIKNKKIELYV